MGEATVPATAAPGDLASRAVAQDRPILALTLQVRDVGIFAGRLTSSGSS